VQATDNASDRQYNNVDAIMVTENAVAQLARAMDSYAPCFAHKNRNIDILLW
jgi:hypothetical protein